MSKHIYAETIRLCDRWYNERSIIIITNELNTSPYENRKLQIITDDLYIAENDGFKRID